VVEDTIASVVEELRGLHPEVAAVGIGAAGFVAEDRATVVFAPHLSWRNEPLRDQLGDRLGLPLVVDNDANASIWAEYRFGAGRGESHLVMVNLGTGIGGGIVLGGQVVRGRHGIAGEFGHMQVVPDGIRCQCGNRGCWEQYASGNAIVREARALPLTAEIADAVEILRGGRSKVIAEHSYDGLPPYGAFAHLTREEVLGRVDELLDEGALRSTGGRFPKLTAA